MISTGLSIIILFEIIFALFVGWGFMHENKLIEFERKIMHVAKKKFRKKQIEICAKWLAKNNMIVKEREEM